MLKCLSTTGILTNISNSSSSCGISTLSSCILSSSSSSSSSSSPYVSNFFEIAKRYRKKPPKKYWPYMWAGEYPYGRRKEETPEETKQRQERILKNRRNRGRNLMDWFHMPHLQYMLDSTTNNITITNNNININNNNNNNNNSENNNNDNNNNNNKYNIKIVQQQLQIPNKIYTIKEYKKYVKDQKITATCRMTFKAWKKYPEPTYWTVTSVRTKKRPPLVFGVLTWRGIEENCIRPIPDIRKRGWIWKCCPNWLHCDPTQLSTDVWQPYLRASKFCI